MTDDAVPAELAALLGAMGSPVPKLYANAVTVMLNNGDLVVLLKHNGCVVGVLNVSYTVAKTLGTALTESVNQLEEVTGHEIMTSSLIGERMKEASGSV